MIWLLTDPAGTRLSYDVESAESLGRQVVKLRLRWPHAPDGGDVVILNPAETRVDGVWP